MKGTKIGCREGDCGACLVILGSLFDGGVRYQSITSCLTPLGNIDGKHVVTIEGISDDNPSLIQLELMKEGGTQCGFCTPGFVIGMTAGSLDNKDPIESIDGNICRCTGYIPIIRATENIKKLISDASGTERLRELIDLKIIPEYFLGIQKRLEKLKKNNNFEKGDILIGGGTDLYVQKPYFMKRQNIKHLIHQKELRYILEEDSIIRIGASTTMSDIIEHPATNKILDIDQLKLIASTPIRNIATLAGNIINASPIADFVIILLALDAELIIQGDVERTIKLDRFYKGYKKFDLQENEYLKEILIPKSQGLIFNFEKVSKRTYLDIASVNSASAIIMDDNRISSIRLSAGGVYEIPRYLAKSSEYLTGKILDEQSLREVLVLVKQEISPISDIRGSSEYKTLLLRQLLIAHFLKIRPDLELGGIV